MRLKSLLSCGANKNIEFINGISFAGLTANLSADRLVKTAIANHRENVPATMVTDSPAICAILFAIKTADTGNV